MNKKWGCAECVEGCCGVRGRMLRSVCGHGAEPMRRACGAFRQGGVNADLLVSIKFTKVQTEGE